MLEVAELGSRMGKAIFKDHEAQLRTQLLQAQQDLRAAGVAALVLIVGDDHQGCHEAIAALNEWMDPRGLATNVFDDPTQEEIERPPFWRYWRALPGKSRMAVFSGAWVFRAVTDRILSRVGKNAFASHLERIRSFEQTLAAEGLLLIKCWLHRPAATALPALAKARDNPAKHGPFGRTDAALLKDHARCMRIVESALQATEHPAAPWQVIESSDRRHATASVGDVVLAALRHRLDHPAPCCPAVALPPVRAANRATVLDAIDLSAQVDDSTYRRHFKRLNARVRAASARAHRQHIGTVMVFEGADAAGKGGVIRRLGAAMHPAHYRVVPIAAPSDEERAQHYLWRFWRQLPRAGYTTIFDRSWYGRVLVERVEGFADQAAWSRAYAEINDFEQQLCDFGFVVLKFWLHIDPDEQLRRFQDREQTPYKQYKITAEDYRNRERWDDYVQAVDDMVARTSTVDAPWHIIPANDKRHARLEVLSQVAKALR